MSFQTTQVLTAVRQPRLWVKGYHRSASRFAWCLPTLLSGRRTQPLVDGVSVLCWRWSVVLGHRDNVLTRKLDRVNGRIGERLQTIDLTTFRAKRFERFPDQELSTVTPSLSDMFVVSACLPGLLGCRRAPLKHSSGARPRGARRVGSDVRQAPGGGPPVCQRAVERPRRSRNQHARNDNEPKHICVTYHYVLFFGLGA